MSAVEEAEPTISQGVLEGLFCRALRPQGAFREELRRVGFDPDALQPAYTPGTWDAALSVAARHVHPGLPREEALEQLGEAFIDGWFQTLTGRLVGVAAPVLGPDGALKWLSRLWEVGAPGTEVASWREAPGDWRFTVRHPSPQPRFDLGLVRAGLRRAGVKATVELLERDAEGYCARVRWPSPSGP